MRTESGHRLFPYPALTTEDRDYMRVYKCRGEDNGLLNNYVLNHVYDFVVEKVLPGWLAPNVLTLSGPVPALITASLCYLLPAEYTDPHRAGLSWVVLNICAALSVFWFLLMDNVDGKHARHIKWCSPLGDWLDHALDIVSYLSITSSFSVLTGLVDSVWIFSAVCALTYTIVIWEAHLCGELIIHPVEGCSEGMFMFGVMHIMCAIFGDPTPWFQKVLFVLPQSDLLAKVGASGLPFTVILLFITLEYVISGMSLLSVIGVVLRLVKKEPVPRVLSALLGVMVPTIIIFGSSALFNAMYPEAVKIHPAASVLQLAAPAIFSIYICNLCRLMGWRFSFIETFTRPEAILFALLPWGLILIPGLTPEKVLLISASCSTGCLFIWFFCVTFALKNMLEIPLLHVGKKKEE